jgi:hypothetical protein
MKRVHMLVPIVLTACFSGYACWWSKAEDKRIASTREATVLAEKAEKDAFYNGDEFKGRDGRKEAQSDIARQAPKLLLYGRAAADVAERAAILKDRLGITVNSLAGCIVSPPLTRFADNYNSEVRQFIAAKFGPNALEQVERDATQRWQTARQKGDQMPPSAIPSVEVSP